MLERYNPQKHGEIIYLVNKDKTLQHINTRLLLMDELEGELMVVDSSRRIPVCKVIDIGKEAFDKKKREKRIKREQKKHNTLKTVKIRGSIAAHDLQTKLKQIDKFLFIKQYQVRIIVTINRRGATLEKCKIENLWELFNRSAFSLDFEGKSGWGSGLTSYSYRARKNG